MSGDEFKLPEHIRVRSSDGLATGEVAAVYLSAEPSRRSLVRVVWDDAELDGLAAVDVGDLQQLDLSLPITGADRDSAELLPDESIERFAHETLAEERAEFGRPPIKKIQPTAPNPPGPAPGDGVLPPIKVIKPGMVWNPGD